MKIKIEFIPPTIFGLGTLIFIIASLMHLSSQIIALLMFVSLILLIGIGLLITVISTFIRPRKSKLLITIMKKKTIILFGIQNVFFLLITLKAIRDNASLINDEMIYVDLILALLAIISAIGIAIHDIIKYIKKRSESSMIAIALRFLVFIISGIYWGAAILWSTSWYETILLGETYPWYFYWLLILAGKQ